MFSTKEDTEKSYEEKQESQKSMNLGSNHEKCCVHNSSGRTEQLTEAIGDCYIAWDEMLRVLFIFMKKGEVFDSSFFII